MDAVVKISKTAVAVVLAVLVYGATAVVVVCAVMDFIKTAVAVVHVVMEFIASKHIFHKISINFLSYLNTWLLLSHLIH